MYRLGLLVGLLVLVAFPVHAVEMVSVDNPSPLFCGVGNVRISGLAIVHSGETGTTLKVTYAGTGYTGSSLVLQTTIPADSAAHAWEVMVPVVLNGSYSIQAVLVPPSGTPTKAIFVVTPNSPPCSPSLLADYIEDATARLHSIP